jgi:hypothetical protein
MQLPSTLLSYTEVGTYLGTLTINRLLTVAHFMRCCFPDVLWIVGT